MQRHDQTIFKTNRSGGPATTSGQQFRLISILNASEIMIYGRSSTSFYGSCEQAANGVIYLKNGPIGKLSITMAPATRFEQWKKDGTFERINLALNQLDRKRVKKEAYPSVLCIDTQTGPPERC